jgi:3-demethoxyubiquinol 3-hydroxylase
VKQSETPLQMTNGLSRYLLQELRSDHAGETGAVYIYKGIQAVAQWRGDLELMAFAKAHGATEADQIGYLSRSEVVFWGHGVWLDG